MTALHAFAAFAVASAIGMVAAMQLPFETLGRDADALDAALHPPGEEASPLLKGDKEEGFKKE